MRCVVDESFKVFHGGVPVRLEAGQVVTGSLAEMLVRRASRRVTELPDEEAVDDGEGGGQQKEAVTPPPPPPPPPPGDDLDIEASVADVLAWVGEDVERAAEALRQEQERTKPRSTLVAQLTKIAEA